MDSLQAIRALTEFHAESVETLIFYAFALIAIPFAFGVIFDRAVIRSGFLLIGVFGAIAGLFLLLQAQFLGMAQLMIYAVGITLVVVIALMLTNPRSEVESPANKPSHTLLTFLTAFLLFITIYMSVRSEWWPVKLEAVDIKNVEVLGRALTTTYSLPFEFSSVLLLAALMGAIMLAKAEKPGSEDFEYSELVDEATPPSPSQTPEAFTPSR
ncbi:MAG TPA: NADH-quinone oxidoreductase subunit J [Chroococcales cyanobacterium]